MTQTASKVLSKKEIETLVSPSIETFFYEMLRIRRLEEAIANRYAEQEMRCPVHLSIGQEAIAVGVCQSLEKSDYVVSGHRAHAHYLAKGGNFKAMLAEMYGKQTGCCEGRGGSMHLTDGEAGFIASTPIVGGSIPVGVGLALASHLKRESRITTIFFGEGATEEGVWLESINFAALKKLPVLFICENNFYSIYSTLEVRQLRSRCDIAKAHGIYTDVGDGNNVDEVFAKSRAAVHHIRNGLGPVFLEFDTYRYLEHCGPNNDDCLGYRTKGELSYWQNRCPIMRLENKYGKELFEKRIAQEIEEAFIFSKESPFPKVY